MVRHSKAVAVHPTLCRERDGLHPSARIRRVAGPASPLRPCLGAERVRVRWGTTRNGFGQGGRHGATFQSHGRGPAPPHPDPLRPTAGRRGGAPHRARRELGVLLASSPNPLPPAPRPSPIHADTLRRRPGVSSPPLTGGGEGQDEVGDHRNGLGQWAAWCDIPKPKPWPRPTSPRPSPPHSKAERGRAASCKAGTWGLLAPSPGPLPPAPRPSPIHADTLRRRSSVPSPPHNGTERGRDASGQRCANPVAASGRGPARGCGRR
jgi:hypothetical protein